MPQKNWEKGYKSKHLGHEDIAAMGIMEILKHLKEYKVSHCNINLKKHMIIHTREKPYQCNFRD